MTSYVKYVEYIAPPFTYASAHAEPDTQAIVGKIGGSWSPFWGGVTLTISHIKQSDTNTEADANFEHKISAEPPSRLHLEPQIRRPASRF
eukprot:scaffold53736_cov39-Cyclotella_meneghiniana.AAC.1